MDTALAVRETVARLIADVYAGRVNPRIAAGLAPLLALQLRALASTNLEQRLEKLETEIHTLTDRGSEPPGSAEGMRTARPKAEC